ncbi:hypothetical protein HK101_009630 [Irineochytrium annulatum]|nr:hypothetical protein HK101_009630 [Irineochytrium annulatum]
MRPTRNLGVFRQVTAAASTLAPKVAPFIPLRTFKRAASSRSTLAAATKSSSAPKSPGAGSWTPDAEYVLLTMVDKLGFSVAKAHEAMQLPGSVRSTKKHYDSIGESRKAGNRKKWTEELNQLLMTKAIAHGQDWDRVSLEPGLTREPEALRKRYESLIHLNGDIHAITSKAKPLSTSKTVKRGLRANDAEATIQEEKPRVMSKSAEQRVSAQKIDVKSKHWTTEEDLALLSTVMMVGTEDWRAIHAKAGIDRSVAAICARYLVLMEQADAKARSETIKNVKEATLQRESPQCSLNAKELKQYLHRIGVLDVGDQKDELTKALHDGLIRFRQRAQRSEWRPYVLAVDVGASTLGYALTTMPRNATVNAPIVVTCGSLPYDASFAAENDLNSVRMVKALRAAVKVLQERFSAVFANVYGADIVPESLYRAVLIGPTVLVPKFKQTNEKSEKTLLESSMMACMATLMKERFALYGCEVNIVGEAAVNFFSVRNRKSTTATKLVDSWVDSNNEIYSPAKFSKMAALEFRDTKVDKEAQSNAVILAVAQWVWERNAAHDYGVLGIEATPDIAHTTSPRHRQKLCRK